MIKLIITDMDGTLLNSKNEISPKYWELEKELSQKGVIFAVASGRPYYNLVEKFSKTRENMLFIAENGACVFYKNKEIYSNPMDKNEVLFLLNIAKNISGVVPIVCGKNSAYVEKHKFLDKTYPFQEEIEKYYNKLELVEDFSNIEDEIFKIAVCDFLISETNSYQHFKNYEDKFKVVVSGQVWLDLMKPDTNKGVAVKMSQDKLNISYDETMTFGDYLNDYELVQAGKYSFAMKNAHPELKKVANFITKEDNNNDGVVKTIEEFFKEELK